MRHSDGHLRSAISATNKAMLQTDVPTQREKTPHQPEAHRGPGMTIPTETKTIKKAARVGAGLKSAAITGTVGTVFGKSHADSSTSAKNVGRTNTRVAIATVMPPQDSFLGVSYPYPLVSTTNS